MFRAHFGSRLLGPAAEPPVGRVLPSPSTPSAPSSSGSAPPASSPASSCSGRAARPSCTRPTDSRASEYNAPNRIDTRFNLASVGKMFTAVAIAQLVEQGKLKWTDTLSKVLPDYPNKAQASRITIHQLLTHTSGMGLYWENLFKGNWTAVRTVAGPGALLRQRHPAVRAGHRLVLQQHRIRGAVARRREGVGRGLFRLPAETHLRSAGDEGHRLRGAR